MALRIYPRRPSLVRKGANPRGDAPSSFDGRPAAAAREESVDITVIIDTFWVLLAAILVFFMNLGFASVEAGLARAKNTVNILSKNFIVFAVSSLGFMLLGWGLMFGGDNPFVGTQHLFILGSSDLSFYDDTLTSNVPFWVSATRSLAVKSQRTNNKYRCLDNW